MCLAFDMFHVLVLVIARFINLVMIIALASGFVLHMGTLLFTHVCMDLCLFPRFCFCLHKCLHAHTEKKGIGACGLTTSTVSL